MTRLSINERAEIRMAIAAGNEPRMTGTDRFQLPLGGRKRKLLVRPNGVATPAGEYWSQYTGAALPEGVDYSQEATRIGPSDYIQVRGKRRRLRTWDPSANAFKYTTFGIKWAAERRVEVVVDIPVLIQGRNPNSGATWSRRGFLPVEQIAGQPVGRLFARAGGTQQEQINEVKRTVLNALANSDNVVYEASGETWVYDDDPQSTWRASTMTTEMGARRPVTTAVLRGSLSSALDAVGGFQPTVLDLPHMFEICDEAFKEANDFLCLPRQIAAMEGLDLGAILDELDICQELCYADLERSPFEVGQSWRCVGATPRMLLELARRWQYQCLVLHGAHALDRFSPAEPKGLFVATWWGGHVYCWEGERAKKSLWRRGLPASPPSAASTRLARIVQRRGETAAAWKPWTCVAAEQSLPEGHFWAPDLHEVRRQFLDRGYSPKIHMSDHHRISAMTLGKTKIHAVPETLVQINAFLQRLPVHVPYRGENVPRLTFLALLALLKPRRRSCPPSEKARILFQQQGRCAICGDPLRLEEAEFDHIVRRELDQTGEQRQQATHAHCHAQKTEQESGLFDQCPLASHLNPDVHRQYHQSAAIPPLNWKAKELERDKANLIVDVKRCRKRALQFASHDLPVLSPFDSIEAVGPDQKLGDLVFINAPYRDFVKSLGYTGPGWYHRVMAEHMLHFGLCDWRAITHRIVATARVPKEALRAPLAEIEQAWDDPDLAKLSINSLIGTLGIRQSYLYEVTTSASELDAPTQPSYQVFTRHARGGVFDWIVPVELRGPRSYRPIWDLILSAEAALVGKLIYLFKQVAPRGLGEFKTDSLCVTVPKRCQGKIEKMVQELKYSDLHVMRQRFEGASGCRRIDEHFPLTPVPEDVSVFRAAIAGQEDYMKTDPSLPERCEALPVAADPRWQTLSEEAAREHVLGGGSLQLDSAAGTGKSYWITQLLEELEAGGRKVQRCAKTHSVASKIKGATLDSFLRRAIVKGAVLPDILWVDEFSLIDATSWCLLNFLLFSPSPVQIILSGDWAQLPSIGSCYKGAALPNGRVEQSQLLHQLCGGTRLTLTVCRRSDEVLFDFYTSLSKGGARADTPLSDVVAEARQLFPKRGEAEYHLVISHARRKAINKALNLKRKPAGAVFYGKVPTPGLTSESQSMWLWPGLEVIACTRGASHGLRHNVRYRIEAVSAATVRLEGVQNELSTELAARHLRLPWASTYASAQGLEFDGRLELCDLCSRHLSRAHLLVGLSRARAHTLVQLGT